MELSYTTVDVFTSKPLTGNQLAVVDVPAKSRMAADKQLMIGICKEFNYSESVFLHEPKTAVGPDSQHGEWDINIFIPVQGGKELPFAGHPTIGTAWLLAQRHPGLKTATLNALAGPLEITYASQNGLTTATASIPHRMHLHTFAVSAEAVISAQPKLRGKLMWPTQPVVSIVKGMTFALVQLNSRARLGDVATTGNVLDLEYDEGWGPSFGAPYFYYIERQDESYVKLHTRLIEGPLEDPATGSAASCLAGHLSTERWRSGKRSRQIRYEISQGEDMGRSSTIFVTTYLNDAGEVAKIELSGTSVKVMEGRLAC